MAENNANQRHKLNDKIVNNGITQSNRGQHYGFITSLAIIGGAVFCAFYGETLPSSILGTLGGIYIIPSIWKMLESPGQEEGGDQE